MVQLPLADLEAPATDEDDLPLVVLVRVIRSHDDPSHARLESAQAGVLASVWSMYVRLTVLAYWAKLATNQSPPPRRVAQDDDRRSLDSVPTVSHAKCRSCGQVRHKIARWNLCQACWEEIKPEVRAEWRRIKDRRRLRRAVDDEVRRRQQQRQRQRDIQAAAERARQEEQAEEPTPMTTPITTETESLAERNGRVPVPPMGTAERALYMRSFLDVPPPLTPEAVRNLLDLYETDITTADLRDLFGVAQGTLQKILTEHDVTTRADRTTPRASGEGHVEVNEHGRFVWVPGQRREETPKQLRMRVERLFGRHLLRAFPQPAEDKEEVPTPVEEPVASPTETESHMEQSAASEARQRLQVQRIVAPPPALVPVPQLAPRRTRHKLSATQADEIVKLYQESDASVQEIVDAYSCSNGQLYRLLEARGLPLRGRDWSPPMRPHPEAQSAAQEITHEEPAVPQPVELVRAWQEPEPAPNGQTEEPQPQPQPVQPIFVARRTDQLWSITYIVHRSQIVNAPDLDAALATVRHNMGHDIDIISVVRG